MASRNGTEGEVIELGPQRIPTWTRTSVKIPAVKVVHGRTTHSQINIDLTRFGFLDDSLLRVALRSYDYPAAAPVAWTFKRALAQLADIPDAVRILGTAPDKLKSVEVARLFFHVDNVVASWGLDEPYATGLHARSILMRMPVQLADGVFADGTGFQTSFPSPKRKTRPHAADGARRAGKSKLPETVTPIRPIDGADFNSLEERNREVHRKGLSVKAELAAICTDSFDRHEQLCEKLDALKRAPPPQMHALVREMIEIGSDAGRKILFNQVPENIFELAVWAVEKRRLYAHRPDSHTFYIPAAAIKELHSHVGSPTPRACHEVLLSNYFLPKRVITSCFVALQLDQLLNAETISGLSPKCVKETSSGYLISGIKPKVNAIIAKRLEGRKSARNALVSEAEITEEASHHREITKPVAIRAMSLLMKNAESIKHITGEADPNLFLTLRQRFEVGPVLFHLPEMYRALGDWCDFYKIPRFDVRHLRALGAQVEYLSPDGSIFSVQALLDHKHVDTTWSYVNTNVVKWLHYANIRRYMDMLAASILWCTDKNDVLARHGLNKRKFRTDLLFPLDASDEETPCIIDQWISSANKKQISIGIDELHHLAMQFQFYRAELRRLAQDNPPAFAKYHIPRILTCIALRNIVLTSVHADIYRELEQNED